MNEETNQGKKWLLIGFAATVVILSAAGVFVPDAREYIMGIIKMLLGVIPGIAQ